MGADVKKMDITRTVLPLEHYGSPEIVSFRGLPGGDDKDHFALIFTSRQGTPKDPLVRIASECVTGDVLGSLRCDCGKQLQEALSRLSLEGGILIYLRQEGRGIGLDEKLRAYKLQDSGFDTYEANVRLGHQEDARSYGLAAEVLRLLDLRTRRIRRKLHLTDNERYATERFFIQIFLSTNSSTLMAKKDSTKQNDLALRREASLITPTYLGTKASKNIAAGINGMLPDVFALYLKTKNFHWHMSGPHFRDYHLLLDEQADQIYAMTDPIAERVRKVGGSTLRSIGHISRLQRVLDNDAGYVEPSDMLAELREDNKSLAARMREAHNVCDEHRDVATASLIEVWIDETERRTWFLFGASREADATGH